MYAEQVGVNSSGDLKWALFYWYLFSFCSFFLYRDGSLLKRKGKGREAPQLLASPLWVSCFFKKIPLLNHVLLSAWPPLGQGRMPVQVRTLDGHPPLRKFLPFSRFYWFNVFMVDVYRRSIRFEKREDHVASIDQDHVSKDGDDAVEDADVLCDDQKASGDCRCVFDQLKYQHVHCPLSVLRTLMMRTPLCMWCSKASKTPSLRRYTKDSLIWGRC